jgi:hypothetical protein
MPSLIQVIYSSFASKHFMEEELPELLTHAREANAARGITGMLVYVNGNFLQVIEGEAAAVDELFATISDDPRHKRVFVIVREPITQRSFSDWSMGFKALLVADVETLIGENDFFDSASCMDAMDAGIVKTIFSSFRQVQDRII